MDLSQLKNGKYFAGKYTDFTDTRGWFIGSFFDDDYPCKTNNIEVLYKEHKAGHKCEEHYHSKKVELLIILEGKANYKVNGKDNILNKGDFIFIDVNNLISGEFLEDSKILAIHSPSIPNDKIVIKK